MNTYCSYVTGPRYEDKLLAGQVTVTSTLSIATNRIWLLIVFLLYVYINAVRGMMYYRRAIKLQAFLDMANEKGKCDFLLFQAI